MVSLDGHPIPLSLADRLKALGLELPAVPAPVALYRPAVRVGQIVYTSGQVPFVDGVLTATGLVGDTLTVATARELAKVCALNCLAAATGVLAADEELDSVVKIVGYVASATSFNEQAHVVDGASALLNSLFPAGHARTSVGVKELPLQASVEVELIATVAPSA